MDLTNYAGLQSAVADFLNRPDLNAGGQIAGFIQLAEATVKRRLRRTTVVTTLTLPSSGNSVALPADCGELRSVSLAASAALPQGGPTMTEVSFETIADMMYNGPTTGRPVVYAVRNGTLYLAPAPASQYLTATISYYKSFAALSGSNTSNPLLVEAPDTYLYGSCLEAAPFLEHDERIPVWQARFDASIEELNEKRQREEMGASMQKARLPVCF